jgi:hypothetical protein
LANGIAQANCGRSASLCGQLGGNCHRGALAIQGHLLVGACAEAILAHGIARASGQIGNAGLARIGLNKTVFIGKNYIQYFCSGF